MAPRIRWDDPAMTQLNFTSSPLVLLCVPLVFAACTDDGEVVDPTTSFMTFGDGAPFVYIPLHRKKLYMGVTCYKVILFYKIFSRANQYLRKQKTTIWWRVKYYN